ncbi:MAG: DUF2752 domain-containing protein [Verrucomicrobiales bacterium]
MIGTAFFGASIAALYFVNRAAGTEYSVCPMLNLTGVPCFFCGGTRASFALLHGQVIEAIQWNPLVALAAAFFLVQAVLKFGFGKKFILSGRLADRRFLWGAAIVLVAANWWWVIWHLKVR